MNHIRAKILLKRVNSLLFWFDICYNFNMNNRDNKFLFVSIIIVLFFILGIIGFILSLNSYNKKIDDSTSYISCPVTKYTIVSGTIITGEMLDVKKFESADDYICLMNLVVGKCIKSNTMVEKGNRIRNSDLVNCEV